MKFRATSVAQKLVFSLIQKWIRRFNMSNHLTKFYILQSILSEDLKKMSNHIKRIFFLLQLPTLVRRGGWWALGKQCLAFRKEEIFYGSGPDPLRNIFSQLFLHAMAKILPQRFVVGQTTDWILWFPEVFLGSIPRTTVETIKNKWFQIVPFQTVDQPWQPQIPMPLIHIFENIPILSTSGLILSFS